MEIKNEVTNKPAETPKPQAASKPAPRDVSVVQHKNDLTLVEWSAQSGRLHRSWMKTKDVDIASDGTAKTVDPGSGVPYGFDFARLISLETTPQAVDTELKKAGIWTVEDLRARPAAAQGAITAAYGLTFSSLLEAVAAHEKDAKAPTTPE